MGSHFKHMNDEYQSERSDRSLMKDQLFHISNYLEIQIFPEKRSYFQVQHATAVNIFLNSIENNLSKFSAKIKLISLD